jgi:glyoxylase-like metal-dependent hydrolase (beta-lactamase superfamily II)
MAVTRVISGVHLVPMANAFLVEGEDGLTLIDAGFPHKEAAVLEAIRGLGRSPDQLKHLIFTHGHPDHIGSAAAIVRETGARTYMHRLDIDIAQRGGPFRSMTPAPGLIGLLCKVFFHPDERVEPNCHRPAFNVWGTTANRWRLRNHSYSWPLRGTGRAALAAGTNAVRRRCGNQRRGPR